MTLITDLPDANSIDGNTDVFPIVNNALNTTQKINRNVFLGVAGNPVDDSTAQTLTNKTLTAPVISSPVINGTVTGTYTLSGTVTLPSTVVTKTGTETLTNKTLTSPTITSPNISNATITADAVNGFTLANNGTIYGVSVVSGAINGSSLTALSVTAAQIQNGTITYNKLSTGSSWAWQSWVPVWTNVAGGTLNYAKYTQIGKTVHFRLSYTLNGAGVSGGIYVTLPVAGSAEYATGDNPLISTSYFLDNAVNVYPAPAVFTNASQINLRPVNTAGTYASFGGQASATVPFTWGANDRIMVTGTYEAA